MGLQIAQEDFKLTFAGSGAGVSHAFRMDLSSKTPRYNVRQGALLHRERHQGGIILGFLGWMAEADEYAKDEPGGHYDNIRALLLCRVCVGSFYYTPLIFTVVVDVYTVK